MKTKIIFSLVFALIVSFFAVAEAQAQLADGAACSQSSQCASGYCDQDSGVCINTNPNPGNTNIANGGSCTASSACQSNNCVFVDSSSLTGECRAQESPSGGCCVVSAGNCLPTTGTTCSNGDHKATSCSDIPSCSASSDETPGDGIEIPTDTGLPDASVKDILKNFLIWILEIVGIIALIAFAISGIQYLIAAGDEDMMQTAKRNMLYSIIGVVVVLASFVIIQAIDTALRAESMF